MNKKVEVIDNEPCICEENKICTDENDDDYKLEYPDCFKVNPTRLCCKHCPGFLMGVCDDPCSGIFKDVNND